MPAILRNVMVAGAQLLYEPRTMECIPLEASAHGELG